MTRYGQDSLKLCQYDFTNKEIRLPLPLRTVAPKIILSKYAENDFFGKIPLFTVFYIFSQQG